MEEKEMKTMIGLTVKYEVTDADKLAKTSL